MEGHAVYLQRSVYKCNVNFIFKKSMVIAVCNYHAGLRVFQSQLLSQRASSSVTGASVLSLMPGDLMNRILVSGALLVA